MIITPMDVTRIVAVFHAAHRSRRTNDERGTIGKCP